MTIDRNEAFKHNSCKKLAQLGKVIFTLTANEIDKDEEKQQIRKEYENSITELFEKQYKQAESIHTNLVRFRKSCIDKSCSEYGNYYKQLKNEYSEIITNQTKKLQDIITELKHAKDLLKETNKNTASQLKQVNSTADNYFNEIKGGNDDSRLSQKKEAIEATSDITKKTENLLLEFEKNLKEMKSQFNNESKKIKKEISKLFKGAVMKRKDELVALYKKTITLKSEAGSIRNDYNNIIQNHQKQSKSLIETRNSILNAIMHGNRDLKKQKDNLALQESKNQKLRQQELNELTKNLKNARATQKQELDKIDSKINEKKYQIQKLLERNSSNSKSRDTALESITECLIRDFEEEMLRRKADYDQVSSEILNIHNENEILIQWSEKVISQAIEKANNKLITFQYKSEQNDKNSLTAFEEEKSELQKQLDEKLHFLNEDDTSAEIQGSPQKSSEKVSLEKLQKEFNETEEKQQKEFQEKFQKTRKEIESYRNSTKTRQEQHVTELETSKSRREKEKQKKIDELCQKNRKEIESKIDEKSKEKQEKIKNLMESENDTTAQLNQTKNFNQKKAKLESLLEFVNKQINDKKNEIEKASTKFQNDLSAVDKSKRQLQRRIETETRKIDDEYEMKIQVAQVNLSKAIENISKLFDADENQRGREVIEAIRKVREKRNKNSDMISRKNKELEDLKQQNKIEINELNEKLNKIQAGDREFQLKKEIENYENKTNEMLNEIETEKSTKIQVINDSISKLTTEHEKNKKKIESQIKQNEKEFLEKSHQIEAEIKAAERFKDERISKLQEEFAQKEEELAKKHASECEKMRKRIETAKSRIDDFEKESKDNYSKQTDSWQKNAEDKQKEIWNQINAEMNEINDRNEKLENEISGLWEKQSEIEKRMIDPPQRNEEKEKIEQLKSEIALKTDEINSKFDNLFNLLSQGPDQNLVQASKTGSKSSLLKTSKQKVLTKSPSNSSILQALPPLEGM